MIYVNMTIPVTILDLCSRYNVRKFINTGTFFEYDLDTFEFSENNSDSAYNLYASTKLSFINTIEFYVKNFPLSVITLRLFSPYGPGEDKKIISLIIDALILNKELSLQDISPELHFTFVSDIARAFILTLKYMDGTDSF